MNPVPFLEAVNDITSRYSKIPKSEFLDCGTYPIFDQGKKDIAGYFEDRGLAANHGEVVIFGDHTRAVKFAKGPFALGADGTKVLCPRTGLLPRYMYWWLQSQDIPSLGYSRHFKLLKELSVPIPKEDEQQRIADTLDKADSLHVKRRATINHLDALSQSIYNEMFGNEEVNGVLSDAICALVGGRNVVGPQDSSNPKRVLKISAVTSGTYRELESKPLPIEYEPDEEHVVQTGDVIISRANTTELVGASALVRQTNGNVVLPDKLWRAVPTAAVESQFLVATLQSPAVRTEMSRRATGSGGSMKNISKPKLLSIPIHLPPLELQQKFARRIDGVERLKAMHRAQLSELDDLFVSLQHSAFKGELLCRK